MSFNNKRVGLILRTFATKAEDVQKRVEAIEKMTTRAIMLDFDRIDILVWSDKRYADSDCGQTLGRIADLFMTTCVRVHNFVHGDLFCGILNYGAARQLRDRIDYSLIASTEAFEYFTKENIDQMFGALQSGAKATGVAINELTESVLDGCLANTMCMWDNVALMSVGGFDLRAQKPVNDKSAHYMRGLAPDGQEVFYHLAGVEEVIPLARLVETYGPCIAPIVPDGVAKYQVPDPVREPELYARHMKKMGTKLERQTALLSSVGYDLTMLENGVMPEYRRK